MWHISIIFCFLISCINTRAAPGKFTKGSIQQHGTYTQQTNTSKCVNIYNYIASNKHIADDNDIDPD